MAGAKPTNPMPMPANPPAGIAKPLWYLSQIDNIFVKQKIELMEMFTNIETNNKYEIQNGGGQQVYFAAEQTGCCQRQCCGAHRAFTITIMDNQGVKVLELTRPLRCNSAWSCVWVLPINCCCLQDMTVNDGDGNLLGRIVQKWSLIKPSFDVRDEKDETVLHITGPVCVFSCCGSDVHFPVSQPDGAEVGMIAKKWSGFAKEVYTRADNYTVNFPMDMPVNHKALLMSASLLLDFMYFENAAPSNVQQAQHQRV
jgi:uncharacterized protein YxjI